MASIRRYRDKWRAEIARQGVRSSKVFATKREAQDWASREEYSILNRDQIASSQTFGEVMDRYAKEVSPAKRGARWEIIRLERLRKDSLAKVQMKALSATDLADWRDRRAQEVAPASVSREMALLSGILTKASKEWRIINGNPMGDVQRPRLPEHRDRLPTADELDRLALSAGDDLSNATARAYIAFRFGMETAMRAGEIVGLRWERLDLATRVAKLPMTKNGRSREVPLSSEALRIIESLPRQDPVFGLRSDQLDALWRKLRDRAAVTDLHFHDSRHAAITALSKKLGVLELARMVGHRDLKMLMTYYNESAADLAKLLD